MTASEFKDEILPCYDTAYAVAMGIVHNSDDARDIVQELFRRLWEKHASLALPASSRSFCAVSARNAALSWMRSNPPGRETVIDGQMSIPDDESDSHSQEDLLPEAISMLDSRHRELIRLSLACRRGQRRNRRKILDHRSQHPCDAQPNTPTTPHHSPISSK